MKFYRCTRCGAAYVLEVKTDASEMKCHAVVHSGIVAGDTTWCQGPLQELTTPVGVVK